VDGFAASIWLRQRWISSEFFSPFAALTFGCSPLSPPSSLFIRASTQFCKLKKLE
jgi:hypothetical protein